MLPCGCFGVRWAFESGYSGDGVAACGIGSWGLGCGFGVNEVVVDWWKCCGVGKGERGKGGRAGRGRIWKDVCVGDWEDVWLE